MAKKSLKDKLKTPVKKKLQLGDENDWNWDDPDIIKKEGLAPITAPITAAITAAITGVGTTGVPTSTVSSTTGVPNDVSSLQGFDLNRPQFALPKIEGPIGPIRIFTPKERAEMERFAKMSPKEKQRYKDAYSGLAAPPSQLRNIPAVQTDQFDVEQNIQPQLGQDQVLSLSEIETSVPQSIQEAQKLSKVSEGVENPKQKLRNPFENVKWNDVLDATQLGLYGVNAFLRKQDAIRNQQNFNRRLRNVFTQKPIYDYNYLYGPDSSGGTQYQSMIMAKKGANIRRGTSPDITDVEVEGGEFIQLPDLSTQHVQGPSHAQGGVHTNLPEGSRVFSDYLKPIGSKKTYAQIAKKYDTDKWESILKNPFASDIDRNTAQKMYQRNLSILNELFNDQQIMNGNSDGTDQYAESNQMEMAGFENMEQEEGDEMVGKFGLDLKKGEKLSFTDPFEYGGEYIGGPAHLFHGGYYQDGGQFPMMGNNTSTFYNNVSSPDYGNNGFYNIIGSPKFQIGGITGRVSWSLPEDQENLFQAFYNTLPFNLQNDDNSYNVRGYWDALGRPEEFDYSQPVNDKGLYSSYVRNPKTGMLLTSPNSPTFEQIIMEQIRQGYKPMIDPDGNIYSLSADDIPQEGYFANYQDGGFYDAESNPEGYFEVGGTVGGGKKEYTDPKTGKKYKVPAGATIKKEGDPNLKAGDIIEMKDGSLRKVTALEVKTTSKNTATSTAQDWEEGKAYINAWATDPANPQNATKLKLAEDAIEKGLKDGTIVRDPKTPNGIIITGKFKPSFKERLAISEVINLSGGGFGTNKYRIVGQKATEGYSKEVDKKVKDSKTGKEKIQKSWEGSFAGGMTPQDYEQRATYERALAEGKTEQEAEDLATSTDPKQKLENKKQFLKEIGVATGDIPETYLASDDFYKNRFRQITQGIENTYSQGTFRKAIGDDLLSGWEHYDAGRYTREPVYGDLEYEPETPPGNQYKPSESIKIHPSTLAKFPLYQAAPEALGFLSGLNPATYYTPDYTHTELAPPTLNIDDELKSIDDALITTARQTTGNPSLDNSRRAGLFNQALNAKSQAFSRKQNFDAGARFEADKYNAAARDLENYRDVTSAAQVYNDYMQVAADNAETERLNAIFNLTDKVARQKQSEFLKALYMTQIPNYYYEGTDPMNPIKVNPYAPPTWESSFLNRNQAIEQAKKTTPSTTTKPK